MIAYAMYTLVFPIEPTHIKLYLFLNFLFSRHANLQLDNVFTPCGRQDVQYGLQEQKAFSNCQRQSEETVCKLKENKFSVKK